MLAMQRFVTDALRRIPGLKVLELESGELGLMLA
jgi:hypothetical protein